VTSCCRLMQPSDGKIRMTPIKPTCVCARHTRECCGHLTLSPRSNQFHSHHHRHRHQFFLARSAVTASIQILVPLPSMVDSRLRPSPPRAVAAASGPARSTYGGGTPCLMDLGRAQPDYAAEPLTLRLGGDEVHRLGSSNRS
jgi:hypothetical protein